VSLGDWLYSIADGAVTVFGVVLLSAVIGGFLALGVLAWISGGPLVGLLALAPVLLLCAFCLTELRDWYRNL